MNGRSGMPNRMVCRLGKMVKDLWLLRFWIVDNYPKSFSIQEWPITSQSWEGASWSLEVHNAGIPLNITAGFSRWRNPQSGKENIWRQRWFFGWNCRGSWVAQAWLHTEVIIWTTWIFAFLPHRGDNLWVRLGQASGTGLISVEVRSSGEAAHSQDHHGVEKCVGCCELKWMWMNTKRSIWDPLKTLIRFTDAMATAKWWVPSKRFFGTYFQRCEK